MKKYDTYKDSGIEWLGEIPEHWNLLKIGRTFSSIGSGTTPKSTNLSYYQDGNINWLNTGDLNDSYITETAKKITQTAVDEFSTLKEYPIDSIVIALYGATIGKLGHLKIPTTTNQACCVISGSDKIQQRFLFYYFLAARDYIISLSYGGGQPNISQDLIRQLYIPTPVNVEQNKIISFLDHKTTQIDTLIEKKEQLVEKLTLKRQAIINEAVTKGLNSDVPMKDSGIEWLGEIPEHWEEAKIKHKAQINGRIGYKGYTKSDLVNEGEGALTLGAKHINKDNLLDLSNPEFISWEKYYESPEIMVDIDDIIFTQRGSLGKVCHINEDIDKATINPSMVILNNIKVESRFLYFWLCSNRIQSEVELFQTNTAVPMISQFQLANFPVIYPSKEEQKEISKYLDETLLEIKKILDKNLLSIDKLKLYRQSLILEAVTGKIDLRDWKQTDNK